MRCYATRWDVSEGTGGRVEPGCPGAVYAFNSTEERDAFIRRYRGAEAVKRNSLHVKNAKYIARVQDYPKEWTAVGICNSSYDYEESDRKYNQPAA
jgi:hypothetical protein